MNTISPILDKVRKIIGARISSRFRAQTTRRRRFEEQLEFPWHAKR
jgi:hypothetical protein